MTGWLAALPVLQFWHLELLLAAVIVLLALEVPGLVRAVDVPARGWLVAVGAGVAAVSFTAGLAPRTNRILYDEHIYQHVGQNMADRRRAEMCNDGRVVAGRVECRLAEYNKQPNGYPHLLSLAYRIAGVSERHAWTVNNVCAGLLPIVVLVITSLLFGDWRAGAYGALSAALMPLQLVWSNTAASEPSASVAAAIAVMAAAWCAKSGRTRALAWTVAATVWASQFRPESVLIVPVVASVVAVGPGWPWRDARLWWASAAGAVLLAPLALHLIAVGGQQWGAPGDRLSASFVPANLAVNGPFYLTNVRFPAAFTLLACLGWVAWRRSARVWLVAAYFAAFWSVYLFFYAGSYDYGADVRYSLLTYPPIAILAGLGAAWVAGLSRRRSWKLVVPLGMVVSCWSFLPLVGRVGEDGWQARADVAAAREFARLVPPDGVVLTHNPSMFMLFGTSAAQMSRAVHEPDYLSADLATRAPGGIFFHYNFWCTVADPVQTVFCTEFMRRFPTDVVADRQERTVRYELRRVRLPVAGRP